MNDLVKKYMPDAPASWDKVTIYNLLTHTSGIPDFTRSPDYGPTVTLASPVEKTIARFRDKPLDFEPGAQWSYDNSGYVLLGYLIEKIGGKPLVTFCKRISRCTSGYEEVQATILNSSSSSGVHPDIRPAPTGPARCDLHPP